MRKMDFAGNGSNNAVNQSRLSFKGIWGDLGVFRLLFASLVLFLGVVGGVGATPTSNIPVDAAYEANSTGNTIVWVIHQDSIGPSYYQVLRNGTVTVSWTAWTNNTNLNVPVDTNIGLGLFNYTIYFNDSQGNTGTPDLVWIIIEGTGILSVENLSASPAVVPVNDTVNIIADVTDTESINFTVSLPDLTLKSNNITFSNSAPVAGNTVIITATISNIGPIDTNSGLIHLIIDGSVRENYTRVINGSSTEYINYSWSDTTAGTHIVTIVLDVNNTIPELNETNNNASRNITVTSPPPSGGPTQIDSCTTITSPGTYELTQDISNSSTCITIESSDVIFDGAGYRITGTGSNSGIYVYNSSTALTNVTVRNVTVMWWNDGIYYRGVENGSIRSNTAKLNNGNGIVLTASSNNTLTNNTASNNDDGIWLSSSGSNTLTGNNAWNNNIGIWLSSSGSNTLSGNTASNNNDGIYLQSSSYNTLSGNTASSNNNYGIYLDSSSYNTLSGNTANLNNNDGIYLQSSSYNTLSGNTASSNNNYGIYLDSSGNNILKDNTMSANTYNFRVGGSSVSHYVQIIDTTNTVDGKPIYYLVGVSDLVIDSPTGAGYVGVVNSINITIRDLTLTKNGAGVLFADTSNSRIENVNASDNYDGIYLQSSSSNTITNNSVSSNNYNGIYLASSSNNTFINNDITDSGNTGIHIQGSGESNKFDDNTISSSASHGVYIEIRDDGEFLYNRFTNNTISGNNGQGFHIYASGGSYSRTAIISNNTFEKNTIRGNTGHGVYLWEHRGHIRYNNFTLNRIINNNNGMYFDSSNVHGNVVLNNIIANNTNYGVYLNNAYTNNFTYNKFDGNTNKGVYFANSGGYKNHFGSTNTYNGNTFYHYYLGTDITLDGLDLNASDDATNLGLISLISTSNSTIRNSNISNDGEYGVFLWGSSNSSVLNNNISNNGDSGGEAGIYLYGVNSSIRDNVFDNNYNGIYIDSSSSNTITNNTVSSNNNNGIYLASSSNNTFINNDITDSGNIGIHISGSGESNKFDDNTISSSASHGVNMEIRDDGEFLYNRFTNNTISGNNGQGFHIYASGGSYSRTAIISNNTFEKNTIRGNTGHGVYLWEHRGHIRYNNFTLNRIINNSNGMYFDSSNVHENMVLNNIIANNTNYGVYLSSSSGNTIYNNLFNNTNNSGFGITSTNTWNITKTLGTNIIGGPYRGGNFWAKPDGTGFSETCTDTDRDGICDSNNTLASGNVDYLPLTLDTTPPTIEIWTDKTDYTTGDTMNVGLNVTNPGSARTVGLYVWLDLPEGGEEWFLQKPSFTLPAVLDYSNLTFMNFTLPDMLPGNYSWHAVLYDPVASEIISESIAPWTFEFQPSIVIYTDKTNYTTGDTMNVGLNVSNPSNANRTVNLSVWLDLPGGGKVWFLQEPSFTLLAGLDYSNLTFMNFTLPDMPPGNYSWHAVLYDPVASEIISESIKPWTFIGMVAQGSGEALEKVLQKISIDIDFAK